jgi:hypothetical protein
MHAHGKVARDVPHDAELATALAAIRQAIRHPQG